MKAGVPVDPRSFDSFAEDFELLGEYEDRSDFFLEHLPDVNSALRRLPFDALRFGLGPAREIYRARTSPAWLAHLASDRYLEASEFREVYGA